MDLIGATIMTWLPERNENAYGVVSLVSRDFATGQPTMATVNFYEIGVETLMPINVVRQSLVQKPSGADVSINGGLNLGIGSNSNQYSGSNSTGADYSYPYRLNPTASYSGGGGGSGSGSNVSSLHNGNGTGNLANGAQPRRRCKDCGCADCKGVLCSADNTMIAQWVRRSYFAGARFLCLHAIAFSILRPGIARGVAFAWLLGGGALSRQRQ